MNQQKKEELKELLPNNHYYCDDPWYSCPKAPEGCLDKKKGTECNCGAEKEQDRIIEIIDQLIQEKVEKIEKLQKYTGGSSVEPKDMRVKLVDVLTILQEIKEMES